MPTVTVELLRF